MPVSPAGWLAAQLHIPPAHRPPPAGAPYPQVLGFFVVEAEVQRLVPGLASPANTAFLWESAAAQVKVSHGPEAEGCGWVLRPFFSCAEVASRGVSWREPTT